MSNATEIKIKNIYIMESVEVPEEKVKKYSLY